MDPNSSAKLDARKAASRPRKRPESGMRGTLLLIILATRFYVISITTQLYHFLDIPAIGSDVPANTMVLGHIRAIHVRNSVLTGPAEPGKPIEVDPTKFLAVSRLGGTTFARIGEGFSIPRPSWRQLEGEVRELIAKKDSEKKPSGESSL